MRETVSSEPARTSAANTCFAGRVLGNGIACEPHGREHRSPCRSVLTGLSHLAQMASVGMGWRKGLMGGYAG